MTTNPILNLWISQTNASLDEVITNASTQLQSLDKKTLTADVKQLNSYSTDPDLAPHVQALFSMAVKNTLSLEKVAYQASPNKQSTEQNAFTSKTTYTLIENSLKNHRLDFIEKYRQQSSTTQQAIRNSLTKEGETLINVQLTVQHIALRLIARAIKTEIIAADSAQRSVKRPLEDPALPSKRVKSNPPLLSSDFSYYGLLTQIETMLEDDDSETPVERIRFIQQHPTLNTLKLNVLQHCTPEHLEGLIKECEDKEQEKDPLFTKAILEQLLRQWVTEKKTPPTSSATSSIQQNAPLTTFDPIAGRISEVIFEEINTAARMLSSLPKDELKDIKAPTDQHWGEEENLKFYAELFFKVATARATQLQTSSNEKTTDTAFIVQSSYDLLKKLFKEEILTSILNWHEANSLTHQLRLLQELNQKMSTLKDSIKDPAKAIEFTTCQLLQHGISKKTKSSSGCC